VPVVLIMAVLAGALWLFLGSDPSRALVVTVSVLIIACPCAMGLATPVSILAGTGRAAELGVLFRQGSALQALGGVDLIAFDKTGTLTEGRPQVVALHPPAERRPAPFCALPHRRRPRPNIRLPAPSKRRRAHAACLSKR
jgi:Cu+-exporting ATPase